MIALRIKDIKGFMNRLFATDFFDSFFLVRAEVGTFATFKIDGKRNPAWEEEKNDQTEVTWAEVKAGVFSLIKGEKPPLFLRAVYKAPEERKAELCEKISYTGEAEIGLFFNLKYENGDLFLYTGVSVSDFLLGKELQTLWDLAFVRILNEMNLSFEQE